jgi:hypothetical protein
MLAPNTILRQRYRIIKELGRGGMGAVYPHIGQYIREEILSRSRQLGLSIRLSQMLL